MPYRLYSAERLKARKTISHLFAPGADTLSSYPIRILFRPAAVRRGPHPVQVTFVVPKKRFKRAVDRNLLKRRMREAYRLNKPTWAGTQVQQQIGMLVMYTGREALPFSVIERKLAKLLGRVADRLAADTRSDGERSDR